MYRGLVFLITVVILFDTLSFSVDAFKHFRNGRLWEKRIYTGPSKYEKWLTQNLDHFNPTDQRTWQQKYFVNEEFESGKRNLAFLEIGGEGAASDVWMTKGSWIDYATEFQPILFQLEHRYYGDSHPTKDTSNANLEYLTSQQAIADLAFFIEYANHQYNLTNDVKWIVFGGSYAGNLAAWVRQKYPHLVHGAMSASGPLLAQLDFKEYFKVVADALLASNKKCPIAVQAAFKQVDEHLKDAEGQSKLNQLFKLCSDISKSMNNHLDIAVFYESLAGNFAGVVQYNKDNRASTKAKNITTDRICDIMIDESVGSEIDRLSAVNSLLLSFYGQDCVDFKYEQMVDEVKDTSWSSTAAVGGRQWFYQTCTEFGYYQTSSYEPQIFGNKFDLDYSIQQCIDVFGPSYNKTFLDKVISRTNALYGGLKIEVSNVVFVHGSLDPWHVLGIYETRSDEAPAILIDGAAHCSNMYPPADDDSDSVREARKKIRGYLQKWIK